MRHASENNGWHGCIAAGVESRIIRRQGQTQTSHFAGMGWDPVDLHGPSQDDELGVRVDRRDRLVGRRQTKLRGILMDCSLPYRHGLWHALQ